ncbi:rok family protein [Novosphingobium sp. Rr 2-17]|uniref:ROK family protein n=1 Tax=Novosphingobium sp. Rr 2-17 TaxID=555793 RepID=UPI0002697ECE|nr:ROK family protein [Novosphingobium sp. Rr 2-17]EIZ79009.1 rok family protein [Novosphingobium sp. Rr 2-17]
MAEPLVAGLELGGTKCFALLGRGQTLVERIAVPTTIPAETMDRLEAQLRTWWAHERFAAIGIGSFGPIGLDPMRADYGFITNTPKIGWAGTDVVGRFARAFAVPIGFDTDVTAAALAEHRWGAAQGMTSSVYLTIGTGIGGGAIVNGRPLRGFLHPEMGHVRVRREAGDTFPGTCPFHADCLEGLASGPAIAARAGRPAQDIAPGDPLWQPIAAAIAELLATLILTLSPQRIAIGGGVGCGQPHLIPLIRSHVATFLTGYVAGMDEPTLETVIDTACFGDQAGPLGTLALALTAIEERRLR